MRNSLILVLLTALLLAACQPDTPPPGITSLLTPPPSHPILSFPTLTITPFKPSPSLSPTASAVMTIVFSPTVPIPFTPTPSQTPLPTPTATFSAIRRTPASLMLHKSSADFDAVAFLEDFIHILKDQNLILTTYQALSANPDLTAIQQGRLVIISIDDIQLIAPLAQSVLDMITLLKAAGYPAVLGVISAGKLPDPGTAQTLQELSALGWEIADHTEAHQNLAELEYSPGDVRFEIRLCADKIEKITGVRPITLILPEGQMVKNAKLLYKEKIKWAVGINGGETFDPTDFVIYVGRESPQVDAVLTFKLLMERFNP